MIQYLYVGGKPITWERNKKDEIMKRPFRSNRAVVTLIIAFGILAGSAIHAAAETRYATPVRITPHVDVRGVYDSNFFRTSDNEESDIYINAQAGLSLSYIGTQTDASASVFASARRYDEFDDNDFETIGQSLRLRYGTRDTVRIEASQSYRRVTEEDTLSSEIAIGGVSPDSALDTATSAKRDILQAAMVVGIDPTEKMQLDLSYRFDFVDYSSRDLDKITTQTGGLEGAFRMTDKSSGIILARYSIQDSDGLDDSADSINTQAGVKTESTDKLTLRATAGYQRYNRPGDLSSEDTFAFDVRAVLIATDKLQFLAGSRNGTQLSAIIRGNSADYAIYYVGARMKATDSFRLSATASYREDEYIDPVIINGVPTDRTDKGTGVNLRADYLAPSRYVSLYTQLTFNAIESPTGDYDRTQISAGIRLEY